MSQKQSLARDFSRLLLVGLKELDDQVQYTKQHPYESYLDLILSLRECSGIEASPQTETNFLTALAELGREELQGLFWIFVERKHPNLLFWKLRDPIRDYHLDALCERGPDPELFQAIRKRIARLV